MSHGPWEWCSASHKVQRWFHLISKCDMLDKSGKASVHKKTLASFKEQLLITDRYRQTYYIPCGRAMHKKIANRHQKVFVIVTENPGFAWFADATAKMIWLNHLWCSNCKAMQGLLHLTCKSDIHVHVTYMLHAGQVEVLSVCGSQEEQCDSALQKVCVIVIVMVTESPGFEWLCKRRVCIALQLAQQQMIYQLKTNRSPVAVPTAKPCKDGFASLANLICWRSRSLNNLKLTRRIGM